MSSKKVKTRYDQDGRRQREVEERKAKTRAATREAKRVHDDEPQSLETSGAVKFREYQEPVFLDHKSGIVVLHWARQIGKSFTLAAWAVQRLLIRPGRLVTVLSNSRDNGA